MSLKEVLEKFPEEERGTVLYNFLNTGLVYALLSTMSEEQAVRCVLGYLATFMLEAPLGKEYNGALEEALEGVVGGILARVDAERLASPQYRHVLEAMSKMKFKWEDTKNPEKLLIAVKAARG